MPDPLADLLQQRFGDVLSTCRSHHGEVTIEVPADRLLQVCRNLRDDADLLFAQLVDLCGVDYAHYAMTEWETSEAVTAAGFSRAVERDGCAPADWAGPRFAVVYHLLSHELNLRLRLRAYAEGEPPRVPSVVEVWPVADWYEREAFDLFGILFEGHPDLRRLLTDYGFIGHPFRKDFPLIGHVQMRYDPDKERVVYEPVDIEPRTLVPRVIRRGNLVDVPTPEAEG